MYAAKTLVSNSLSLYEIYGGIHNHASVIVRDIVSE
jgi:hypothetical protein